jgi:hypothetical protein
MNRPVAKYNILIALLQMPHVDKLAYSYEKLKTCKHFSSLLTNQNSIHEEVKCIFKAVNSYYYSVQTLLSSTLLSKKLKIKVYKKIILPVVQHGFETIKGGTQAKGI